MLLARFSSGLLIFQDLAGESLGRGLDAEGGAVRREGLGDPFPRGVWGLFVPLLWESVRQGCCCGSTRCLNNNNKKIKKPSVATEFN